MRRDDLLLSAAGVGIVLTQHVAVREIGSTFFSTELVLIGATAVTLMGPSVAYAIAHRIPAAALAAWGCLGVAAHLALPFGLRALVGALAARGAELLALTVTAGGAVVLLCGFHAVFLPRLALGAGSSGVEEGEGIEEVEQVGPRTPRERPSLARLYAAELAGALLALAVIAASPSHRVTLAAYWASALVVLHLGLGRRAARITAAAGAAAALLVAFSPELDRWAAKKYFAGYHGLRAPAIVETEYSPYQRIDVVEYGGEQVPRRWRALYLDGVPFHRTGGRDPFNTFLAGVPGALRARGMRPPSATALVLGSGSFSSAAHLRRLGYEVTVVELDEAVARIGFARFAEGHGLLSPDVRLVIEDGRRFLARTEETFDLIALDVPAPYHLRTALLHTPRFYRSVAARLRPGGVAALSLCGPAFGETARAIAASAAEVFPSLIAVEPASAGIALLYAGAPLPFSAEQVLGALERDPRGGMVFGDAEVRAAVAGVAPLREDRLAPVLALAREELEDTLRGR